jgi:hypothetical protein
VGVGFGPNPNERMAGASWKLSTGYPQARAKVIHRLSTGQNRCVKATNQNNLVDNRVNSSDFTVEQSSCESYSIVEYSSDYHSIAVEPYSEL